MRESLPAEKKKRENFFDGIAGDYKMKRRQQEVRLNWSGDMWRWGQGAMRNKRKWTRGEAARKGSGSQVS